MAEGSPYTKPQLRERIKDRIMAGDDGGKPGQWSARKSQLLVQQYEKEGGGYTSSERTEKQKSLGKWTDQEWTTPSGKPSVQGEEATGEVYAPKRTIERLRATPAGRAKLARATAEKRKAAARGEQFAGHGLNKNA